MNMKSLVSLCAALVWLVGAGCANDKIPPPDLRAGLVDTLESYLDALALAPDAYVVSKFGDHDVVVLGEIHRVKHQVEFIRDLIPELYKAGVYNLATEFGRREDQALIDSLLALSVYDEALAREINFRQFVHWAYEEYVDIYRAAWQVNSRLPEGAPAFRILGMNDSPDWTHVKTQADRDNDAVKKLVWKGGGEEYWAQVVLDEVERGQKVLVYCGIHHGFTEFLQPVVNGAGEFLKLEDRRMGTWLYKAIGKRAITVYLHAPWNQGHYGGDFYYPVDGTIDALMALLGSGYYPVGFDTRGTPFGGLSCEQSVYGAGYEDLTLEMFCDGYIYMKPLSLHEGTTVIEGYYHEENIERARAGTPNPDFRDATAGDFQDAAEKSADMAHRYRKLH
jgi:hypothetical protein